MSFILASFFSYLLLLFCCIGGSLAQVGLDLSLSFVNSISEGKKLLPFANHSQNCYLQRNAAPENVTAQRLKSTPGHGFTRWVMCGPHPRCWRVIFLCCSEHAASMMLHSNEGVESQSSKPAIQLGFLTYQAENSFTKENWIAGDGFVYMVGHKTRLDWGVDLDTPLWQNGGATVVCSATAYKAQRLWDTSACSATAALITAETLTVCHISMLGPHFHSRYLQYPKIWHFSVWEEESVCIFVYRTRQGMLGWAEWVDHQPQKGILRLTHTVDLKQPWTNGSGGLYLFLLCVLFPLFLWY